MTTQPFLQRVKLRNYKSIAACDIQPGRLNFLVGRNGAGKSNFVDALRFVHEGLQTSLDQAIKLRGGIDDVRRRSTGHPHNFSVQVEINLSGLRVATYAFEIASRPRNGFAVKREKLVVSEGALQSGFTIADGEVVEASLPNMPAPAKDRLYLVTASGYSQFREAYDGLLAMGFYNLNPEQMKEVQPPDAGELLRRDGSNLASVLARLSEDNPALKERIKQYLARIVPEVVDFVRVPLGHRETVEFRQQVKGASAPWRFYAANMSDGTLRALGILVATMQLVDRHNQVRLVGIEEPETALHPAAAGALMDALREAASNTQIILTSHSPDLLDQFDAATDSLFVVQSQQGTSQIGRADEASLNVLRNHLYSAGELLRMDQLQPDHRELQNQLTLSFD